MKKIFFIRAAITPIELLLRRNPFIVLFTDQQALVPPAGAGNFKLLKPFKPLKLLYG